MADELNIPTHRWYQKRNHIALAKEDFSRQYIYDSGIQKIDAWINSQPWGDVYIVNRLSPPLVFDFIEDYYRTGGSASTFDDALNFSRASAATYIDADGVLQTADAGVPRVGHHLWNGTAWVDAGYFHESESRVQLLHTTNALVTQIYTVTAVPHTLHFTGTGTVTLSGASTAGPLVGTGTGEENRVSLTFTPTAASLTLTVTGTVTNAQLEVGSTPSSYIPNLAGSGTVTRAADTMTIPAANLPWPEPEVIGPELVTNGTFDTDLTGWTNAATPGTITLAANKLRLTADSAVSCSAVTVLSGLTIGNVYQLFYDLDPTNAGGASARFRVENNADLSLGNGPVNTAYSSGSGAQIGVEAVFVATAVTMYCGVRITAATTGVYTEIDNISVREINPLAVSIQMSGTMTYADEDTAFQVRLFNWQADSQNLIYARVDSRAADSFLFVQGALDVFDFVETADGVISSGINVPFNIASRHGSTFINGAVDGTALTADLTPTALPDLSATDMQIGFDFMGTIDLFRMWKVDITDEGIAEATT